ncbi:MAG: uracil-DNA glycosylase [Cypionkella sp.]
MGIAADILDPTAEGWHAALAALEWHYEVGVTDFIGESPLNRYDLPEKAESSVPMVKADKSPVIAPAARPQMDVTVEATRLAGAATSIDALHETLLAFDRCELKRGARNTIFAQGNPTARVMVLGDAPRRVEDLAGLPFQGPEGTLFDRMFAAIGLSRDTPDPARALYLASALPWPTPLDRDPSAQELALLAPFVHRHIELASPEFIVVMGNAACQMVLQTSGIQRLRGQWGTALGIPVLPMLSPRWLLKHPAAKREAWADLLSLKARL